METNKIKHGQKRKDTKTSMAVYRGHTYTQMRQGKTGHEWEQLIKSKLCRKNNKSRNT